MDVVMKFHVKLLNRKEKWVSDRIWIQSNLHFRHPTDWWIHRISTTRQSHHIYTYILNTEYSQQGNTFLRESGSTQSISHFWSDRYRYPPIMNFSPRHSMTLLFGAVVAVTMMTTTTNTITLAFTIAPTATTITTTIRSLPPIQDRTTTTTILRRQRPERPSMCTVVYADATATTESSSTTAAKETFEFTVRHMEENWYVSFLIIRVVVVVPSFNHHQTHAVFYSFHFLLCYTHTNNHITFYYFFI